MLPTTSNREGERPVFEGCVGCLAEGSALHVCSALTRYEGPIRKWIPGFKNSSGPFGPATAIRLAIDHLATTLALRVAMDSPERPDLIASVPLHSRRQRNRAFNHVDPIAARIATTLALPFLPDALERIRDTSSQAGQIASARRESIRGAFRATTRLGRAQRVWLVDDVLTTGSTLDAAANALLDAGCVEVRALTLAATLPACRAPRNEATYHAAASRTRSNRGR
jgi:ComF family protein